jgi:hypothetical protein
MYMTFLSSFGHLMKGSGLEDIDGCPDWAKHDLAVFRW